MASSSATSSVRSSTSSASSSSTAQSSSATVSSSATKSSSSSASSTASLTHSTTASSSQSSASSSIASTSSAASTTSSASSSASSAAPSASPVFAVDEFQSANNWMFTKGPGSFMWNILTDGTAQSGTSYIQISGLGSGTLTLDTTATLVAGTQYLVSFYYRSIATTAGSSCSVTLSLGTTTIATSPSSVPSTWTLLSGNYVAMGGETASLSFAVVCQSDVLRRWDKRIAPSNGVDFDNLSMNPVVASNPGIYTPVPYAPAPQAQATPVVTPNPGIYQLYTPAPSATSTKSA